MVPLGNSSWLWFDHALPAKTTQRNLQSNSLVWINSWQHNAIIINQLINHKKQISKLVVVIELVHNRKTGPRRKVKGGDLSYAVPTVGPNQSYHHLSLKIWTIGSLMILEIMHNHEGTRGITLRRTKVEPVLHILSTCEMTHKPLKGSFVWVIIEKPKNKEN